FSEEFLDNRRIRRERQAPQPSRGADMAKTLLTVGFGALAMTAALQPAMAADPPSRPIYKAPPGVEAYTWSGFYIGGSSGHRCGRANTDQTDGRTSSSITECFRDTTLLGGPQTGATSTVICAPNTTTTFPIAAGPTTTASGTNSRADVNGFIGGGQ